MNGNLTLCSAEGIFWVVFEGLENEIIGDFPNDLWIHPKRPFGQRIRLSTKDTIRGCGTTTHPGLYALHCRWQKLYKLSMSRFVWNLISKIFHMFWNVRSKWSTNNFDKEYMEVLSWAFTSYQRNNQLQYQSMPDFYPPSRRRSMISFGFFFTWAAFRIVLSASGGYSGPISIARQFWLPKDDRQDSGWNYMLSERSDQSFT